MKNKESPWPIGTNRANCLLQKTYFSTPLLAEFAFFGYSANEGTVSFPSKSWSLFR